MLNLLLITVTALAAAMAANFYQLTWLGVVGVALFALASAAWVDWTCRVLPSAIFLEEEQSSKHYLNIPFDEEEEPAVTPSSWRRLVGAGGIMAVVGSVLFYQYGVQAVTWTGLGIAGGLLAIAWLDAETMLMPDALTQPALWATLGLAALGVGFVGVHLAVIGAIIGYSVAWGLGALAYMVLGKEGLGGGDYVLLAVAGALLGPYALALVWLLSSVIAIVSMYVLHTAEERANGLPFGPHIVTAVLILLLTKPWLSPALSTTVGWTY